LLLRFRVRAQRPPEEKRPKIHRRTTARALPMPAGRRAGVQPGWPAGVAIPREWLRHIGASPDHSSTLPLRTKHGHADGNTTSGPRPQPFSSLQV
jgi:hypothetical protein